jgi:hypothetical protein
VTVDFYKMETVCFSVTAIYVFVMKEFQVNIGQKAIFCFPQSKDV